MLREFRAQAIGSMFFLCVDLGARFSAGALGIAFACFSARMRCMKRFGNCLGRLKVYAVAGMLGFPLLCQAQNVFYVRAGAAGSRNGTDWNNAYATLPSTLQRGATYYLADGAYSGYTFDDANSGTSRIIIKKATSADHGTEIGWDNGYGDGQAVFNGGLNVLTDYWTLDGNSPLWSYGFRIKNSSSMFTVKLWSKPGETGVPANFIDLRGIEIDLSSASGDINAFHGQYGNRYVTIQNCRIYECPADAFSFTRHSNLLIEHCHVDQRGDSQGVHADAFVNIGTETGNVFRYNVVEWNGQQVYIAEFNHKELQVYGNVFKGDNEGQGAAKGIWVRSHNPTVTSLKVYNNTFVNLGSSSLTLGSNTTGDVRNNIFYNAADPGFGGATHDFNWYQTGKSTKGEANAQTGDNPFVNYIANNFRLNGATQAGQILASLYNVDVEGAIRGADGTWDRGAYEYSAGDGVSVASVSAVDGNATEAGPTTGQWTVNITPATAATVNVSVTGAGVTSSDYVLSTPTSGVSIQGNHPNYGLVVRDSSIGSALIQLTPVNDAEIENDETAIITILSGTGYLVGQPSTASIVITDDDAPSQVETPSISPAVLNQWPSVTVEITHNEAGAKIHYTTNGDAPTTTSPIYSSPFVLGAGQHNVKAFGVKSGFLDSELASQTYHVNDFVSQPSFREAFVGSRTGAFVFTYEATPQNANMDGLVTMSPAEGINGYEDNAVLVRFNPEGVIDARHGSGYAAASAFAYVPGTTYEFRVTIDATTRTYDVEVRQLGTGSYTVIADDWGFRTEQSGASELSYVGWIAEIGSLRLRNVMFQADTAAPNPPTGFSIISQ